MGKHLTSTTGMGVQQQGPNECWFASYLMVENYGKATPDDYTAEKTRVQGTQQYQDYTSFTGEEPFRDGVGEDMIQACLRDKGLQYNVLHGSKIQPQAVEQAIAADHPVIMGCNIGKKFGHFVVATAIDGDVVTYIDPMNPATTKQGNMSTMNLGSIMVP